MRRNLTVKDKAIFHGAPFKEFEIIPQHDGTLIINTNFCNTEISASKGVFGELHLRIIHSDPKPGKGAEPTNKLNKRINKDPDFKAFDLLRDALSLHASNKCTCDLTDGGQGLCYAAQWLEGVTTSEQVIKDLTGKEQKL